MRARGVREGWFEFLAKYQHRSHVDPVKRMYYDARGGGRRGAIRGAPIDRALSWYIDARRWTGDHRGSAVVDLRRLTSLCLCGVPRAGGSGV